MKLALSAIVLAGLLGAASPALACSQLSHARARQMQISWEDLLARARTVTGRYRETNYDEQQDVSTGVIVDRRGRSTEAGFRFARSIICPTLRAVPSDGDYGRFYLARRNNDVIHYEPRREPGR